MPSECRGYPLRAPAEEADVQAATVPLHEDLGPIAFLVGTWRGEGAGEWPASDPFRYGEELIFEHVGKPRLHYTQSSWDLEDDSPVHFERGFFRIPGPGKVGIVLAHQMGAVEVAEGTVNGSVIELASTSVGLLSSAPEITELRRRLEVDGNTLTYELWMAMQDIPLTHHVKSVLEKVPLSS
jgi:THAP4-like, heme-binding beta-barrel domain